MGGKTVFFSWQSDRPTRDCRNFIEKALEAAVQNISTEIAVDEPPRDPIRVDRDTKDVAGSPPIFDTILRKIESAAVFVPDLTFVAQRPNGDPTPNPNVLIEYGYALKTVTCDRIVAVMNDAYGKPTRQSLPFDLADYRFPITYALPSHASDETRKSERAKLAKELERAIRMVLESESYQSTLPKPSLTPLREPVFGRARFRRPEQPIGIYTSQLSKMLGKDDGSEVTLADGPAMWLRVAPERAISKPLRVFELEQRMIQLVNLHLFDGGGQSLSVRSDDGFGLCMPWPNSPAVSTVFVFTDGEIWAIDTFSLRTVQEFIALDERMFAASLDQSAKFLADMNIAGPYRWIAGFEGVKGRYLPRPNDPFNRRVGPCVSDVIEEKGIFSLGETASVVLEPFFESVFDKCGLARPVARVTT